MLNPHRHAITAAAETGRNLASAGWVLWRVNGNLNLLSSAAAVRAAVGL
jgi:hypothetical protein